MEAILEPLRVDMLLWCLGPPGEEGMDGVQVGDVTR